MMRIKTLIVEDDIMITFLHKRLLTKHGISCEPLSFLNGKEALNFLLEETDKSCLYLILLDLNMPVMNGWEFLDELEKLQISDRTMVSIVTSSVDRIDVKKAQNYKVVEMFLTKPLLNLEPIRSIKESLYEKKH